MIGQLGPSLVSQAFGVMPAHTHSLRLRVKAGCANRGNDQTTELGCISSGLKRGVRRGRRSHPFSWGHNQSPPSACPASIFNMQTYLYRLPLINVMTTKINELERRVVIRTECTGNKPARISKQQFLFWNRRAVKNS